MNQGNEYLNLIKEPCMINDFLEHVLKLNWKTSMHLYLGAVFGIYCGLSLDNLLEMTVHEAAGNSYLNPKTGRLLIYSNEFTRILNDYISKLPSDCPYLFNNSSKPPYKPISVPYFSKSMSAAFESFQYNGKNYSGNYTTLVRTYIYHFISNYGSCDSSLLKGKNYYTPKLLSMVSMTQAEYDLLVAGFENRNFLKLLPEHTYKTLLELDNYIKDYPNCIPLKNKIANFYRALYELSECMAISDE